MTEQEISRIIEGAGAAGWAAHEVALLSASDKLHADAFVTDDTWAELAAHYDTRQLMDIAFTVGARTTASMALHSSGEQLDEGLSGFLRDPIR